MPTRIALRTVSAAEAIARPTRRPPRVTRYAVLHLSRPWTLDISRARDALGYVPAWTAFDGPLHDPVLDVGLVPAGGARARRA